MIILSAPEGRKKPSSRAGVRPMLSAALMTALIAVFSQIALPLPLVPMNFALLAVFLAGFMLPRRWALIAVGAYLFMGALGLPVFSGLRGGPQALFGSTGGYLLGYLFSVSVIVLLRDQARLFSHRFLLSLLALLACYIPGTLWLMMLTGRTLHQVLPLAVYPFIPGDLLKCLLAASLSARLQALIGLR